MSIKFDIETFDQDKFSAEIRAFMQKHKISTRQFPKVFRTPYTSFCRIERRDHGLTIKTAQNLLKGMADYKAQRRIASSKKS